MKSPRKYFSDGLPTINLGNPSEVCAGIREITREVETLASMIRLLRREVAGLSFNQPTKDIKKLAQGRRGR